MKLSNDKKLVELLREAGYVVSVKKAENILDLIDTWLEQGGFHIYPVKKEKYEKPSPTGFKKGDLVEITDETHPLHGTVGKVLDWGSFAISIEVVSQRLIIPNEFLKAHEPAKEKGTVSFKEVGEDKFKEANDHFRKLIRDAAIDVINAGWKPTEEKPSADGEETLLEQTIKNSLQPKDLDLAIQQNLAEMIVQKFTPWQCCPVCEGRRKTFDSGPAGISLKVVDCYCCSGSGVIPMKREVRK